MVWLKIREHDIQRNETEMANGVVVWLKIREHDIVRKQFDNKM